METVRDVLDATWPVFAAFFGGYGVMTWIERVLS